MSLIGGFLTWENVIFVTTTLSIFYVIHKRKIKSKMKSYSCPMIQQIHRLPAHSPLTCFTNEYEARKYVGQVKCSSNVKMLNGQWDFQLFDNVQDAINVVGHWKERKTNPNRFVNSLTHIEEIQVPGHWQLQVPGDAPIYTNIKYIIPVDPPNVPKHNPTAYYRLEFQVKYECKERVNIIHFDGVDNAFYFWCNKQFIGFSKDSRLPAEFDLTNFLIYGDEPNEIELVVVRYSDGYYLEDQDMFNLSGIFRDVYLYSLPYDIHMDDYDWRAVFDSNTQIATIHVTATFSWSMDKIKSLFDMYNKGITGVSLKDMVIQNQNYGSFIKQLQSDWILETKIFEEGILIGSSHTTAAYNFVFDSPSQNYIRKHTSQIPLPSQHSTSIDNNLTIVKQYINVNTPNQWSAEKPHNYTMLLILKNTKDDAIIQIESCRVGFRTVDIYNGLLRVNSRPILVRGVNYHEHDPNHGHTLTPQLIEADIKLMKRHNFNAVRLSHYPHATHWVYEFCTLYGMYVVDEANIETHGMKPSASTLANDPIWEEAFFLRLQRMYQRDKIYVSIICWSLGNESGYGYIHDKMAAWIRAHDVSRMVIYEPASYGPRDDNTSRTMATDILCPMYARVDQCIKLANIFPDMPLILCEYAHMMGNSGGNLHEYWDAFHRLPRLQGGFIWDWADQGIAIVDGRGGLKWGYGGDFGEVEHDANFCLNGLTWPDRGLSWVSHRDETSLDRKKFGTQLSKLSQLKNSYGLNAGVNTLKPATKSRPASSRLFTPSKVLSSRMSTSRRANSMSGIISSSRSNLFKDYDDELGSVFTESEQFLPDPDAAISVCVDKVLLKPALLEAKQCQKNFNGHVIAMKIQSIDNYSEGNNTPTIDTSLRQSFHRRQSLSTVHIDKCQPVTVSLSFRLHIQNMFDSITDMLSELSFTSILLHNGIVVGANAITVHNSGFIHRDNDTTYYMNKNGGSGPASTGEASHGRFNTVQEVDCDAVFSVVIHPDFDQSIYARHYDEVPTPDNDEYEDDYNDEVEESGYEGSAVSPNPQSSENDDTDNNDNNEAIVEPIDVSFDESQTSQNNVVEAITRERKRISYCIHGVSWPCNFLTDPVDVRRIQHELDQFNLLTTTNEKSINQFTSHISLPDIRNDEMCPITRSGVTSEDIKTITQPVSTDATIATTDNWSLVVIGSLANKTAWAPKGFPVGFQQINVTNFFHTNLYPFIMTHTDPDAVNNSNRASPMVAPDVAEPSNLEISWQYKASSQGRKTQPTHIVLTSAPRSPEENCYEYSIDASTGLFDQIFVDGDALLVPSPSEGDSPPADISTSHAIPTVKPCRLQFQRAATDNDRYGYLPLWEACGLTKDLKYIENHDFRPIASSAVINRYYEPDSVWTEALTADESRDLKYIQVEKLKLADPLAQGVQCSWSLEPAFINKQFVKIIRIIQTFLDDPTAQTKGIVANNSLEENYIHQIAAIFQLGRESSPHIMTSNAHGHHSHAHNSHTLHAHHQDAKHKTRVLVKLWKSPVVMCSTIPRAEEIAGHGPIGLSQGIFNASEDEFEYIQSDHSNNGLIAAIKVVMKYIIYPTGEIRISGNIDACEFPAPFPRIGLQLNLRDEFKDGHVSWYGAGPHESYPDRYSSCVRALHRSPATQLYTPYIVPGENGSRAKCSWIQLDAEKVWYDVNEDDAGDGMNFNNFPLKYHSDSDTDCENDIRRRCQSDSAVGLLFPSIKEPFIAPTPPKIVSPRPESEGSKAQLVFQVFSQNPFNFSSHEYTTEDLSQARHNTDLERHPRPFLCVNVDPHLMGIGGDDSWTACVHEDYMITPDVYSFDLTFAVKSRVIDTSINEIISKSRVTFSK